MRTSTGPRTGRAAAGAVVVVLAAVAVLLGVVAARPTATAAPTPAAPTPAAPTPAALADLPAATAQAVLVEAPSRGATTATLSAWERRGAEWVRARGPVPAHLGTAGIGASSESAPRTPAGTFGITRAFGRAADPGTALPYDRVGPDDWWVSDTASPAYNQPRTCRPGTCPFDEAASENLQDAGPAYDHAIVIDANTDPVRPGAGSAYFLHVGDSPTEGCVATSRAEVVGLLRWLRPGALIKIM